MKTILCYGDSNTHGYNPKNGGRFPRDVRWTGRLQQMFGEDAYIVEEGLNGRTTVWEDPIEGYKSGLSYLVPCLYTHKPIDIFVLMLGTNDLKHRFHLTASEIASGCKTLIETVQTTTLLSQGYLPKILLISPMLVPEEISNHPFGDMFIGESCEERSLMFAKYYKQVAKETGCEFFDAAEHVAVSVLDYLHMDAKGHERFAEALYKKLTEML